ncbi:unnamed protein product, partial [Ectocarpus sp. 13 AM-2016]
MKPAAGKAVLVMLSALPTPATSFLVTSAHLRLLASTRMSRPLPSATLPHRSGRCPQQHLSSCGTPSRRSSLFTLEPSPSRRRCFAAGVSGPLRIGLEDCPSEEECEIVYDDDDDGVDEGASSPEVSEEKTSEAKGAGESPPKTSDRDSGSDSDRGGAEGEEGTVEGMQQQQQQQESMSLPDVDREGLEHKEKV